MSLIEILISVAIIAIFLGNFFDAENTLIQRSKKLLAETLISVAVSNQTEKNKI